MIDERDILYLDNHLLVLNKSAGMLVQGDASGDLDLLTAAKAYVKKKFDKPGQVFLGLVHRIDRPVSGAIVFARTSKAASRLARQFRNRSVTKKYIAVVEGRWAEGGTLVDHVWKDHRTVRVVKESHPKGLRAELTCRTLGYESGQTLVDVELTTGRPHQIRVQLAHRKHPIVGDFKYGASSTFDGRNMALHSYMLELEHPTRNERMRWFAPVSEPWAKYFPGIIARLYEDQ